MTGLRTTTLDSGLRVITDAVPSMHSVALGIWVGVGTRNEELMHNGCAHMLEHMMFKGTKNRDATTIAEEIENVGGHMNAYTSREVTSYHTHMLKEDVPLAIEVLADMYQNSSLPIEEIERERQVILQEIGMCNDTPDDLVFDYYYQTAYPNQSLGAPILGQGKYVENMSHSTLLDFMCRYYTPSRTVISAAGDIDHDAFVALIEKHFSNLPNDINKGYVAAFYEGGDFRYKKDLEQAHFILGFQSVNRLDEGYYTAQALSTLLGGGMSSRLFQEVREKRGLVYSIFSFNSGYQDDGQFGIYAGTSPEKMGEIIPVVCDEILKLSCDIKEVEIERAKAQLKSSLLIGRESMMTRADQHAKHMLFKDSLFDIDALISKIDAITPQKISTLADKIFATKPTIAALGPLDKLEEYNKIEERLAA